MYTRFICRFHTIIIEEGGDKTRLKKMVLGETFSSYPYNPEHVNYRKRNSKPMLTSLDKGHGECISCNVPDFNSFWLSSVCILQMNNYGIPCTVLDAPFHTSVIKSGTQAATHLAISLYLENQYLTALLHFT